MITYDKALRPEDALHDIGEVHEHFLANRTSTPMYVDRLGSVFLAVLIGANNGADTRLRETDVFLIRGGCWLTDGFAVEWPVRPAPEGTKVTIETERCTRT